MVLSPIPSCLTGGRMMGWASAPYDPLFDPAFTLSLNLLYPGMDYGS